MSKKFWSALVAFSAGSFLSSCNFASPETYFEEAVLNELGKPFAAKHNIKVDWQTRLF